MEIIRKQPIENQQKSILAKLYFFGNYQKVLHLSIIFILCFGKKTNEMNHKLKESSKGTYAHTHTQRHTCTKKGPDLRSWALFSTRAEIKHIFVSLLVRRLVRIFSICCYFVDPLILSSSLSLKQKDNY